jgi:hypothetical protein
LPDRSQLLTAFEEFVFELRCGTASKDCIEFLRSSLQMIGDARKNGSCRGSQTDHDFDEVLLMAQVSTGTMLEGEIRDFI